MGLFSRARQDAPAVPFVFEIDELFTIPLRGTAFTGRVLEGRVSRGQAAVLHLADGERRVTVNRLESRRKAADAVEAGAEAALYLDGLEPGDVPVKPGGGGTLLDGAGLAGVRIVSA